MKRGGNFNREVYEKLKKVARAKALITYSDLNEQCKLGLDFNNINDRNKIADMLGTISEIEVLHENPMLSVVVVKKNSLPRTPSDGFFRYADKLKVRLPGESDRSLYYRQLRKCYECWGKK